MSARKPNLFGTRLRAIREALGLTRKHLASLAKVSDATIRNLEKGYGAVGGFAALKILKSFVKLDPGRASLLAEVTDLSVGSISILGSILGLVLPEAWPPAPFTARITVDGQGDVAVKVDAAAI